MCIRDRYWSNRLSHRTGIYRLGRIWIWRSWWHHYRWWNQLRWHPSSILWIDGTIGGTFRNCHRLHAWWRIHQIWMVIRRDSFYFRELSQRYPRAFEQASRCLQSPIWIGWWVLVTIRTSISKRSISEWWRLNYCPHRIPLVYGAHCICRGPGSIPGGRFVFL